jgi:hypothetical protein
VGLGLWALLAVLGAALAGLIFIPVREAVPAYAMDSVLLFRVERTLALVAALLIPALVIGPLLAGALPQKLSSDGIDWGEDRDTVVESLANVNRRVDELEQALAEITEWNG